MTGLFSHSVGDFIIPIDELIFFRGVGLPPTRCIYVEETCVNNAQFALPGCPLLYSFGMTHLATMDAVDAAAAVVSPPGDKVTCFLVYHYPFVN